MIQLRYFAYGSNMHPVQMRERCPESRLLGTAHLAHYLLQFNKMGMDQTAKANIIPSRDSKDRVFGVVYHMTQREFDQLDPFEKGYRRIEVPVLFNQKVLSCLTYTAQENYLRSNIVPKTDYLKRILEAARHHEFPPEFFRYLEEFPLEPS